jgi:hypothetical protein
MNSASLVCFVVAAAASFCANASANEIAPGELTCQGPFARDSSHLKLERAFGQKNVVIQEVEGVEGQKELLTIIYPNDPRRRLTVFWKNENARQGIDAVRIAIGSHWTVGHGLKLGMTVDEVEVLNGTPFEIGNFYEDHAAGAVTSWRGGELSKIPGGCQIGGAFEPADRSPGAYEKLRHEDLHLSNDPNLRAMRPKITGLGIYYPTSYP